MRFKPNSFFLIQLIITNLKAFKCIQVIRANRFFYPQSFTMMFQISRYVFFYDSAEKFLSAFFGITPSIPKALLPNNNE